MSRASFFLNGIYPPLPTPFDDKEKLYLDGLLKNISVLNQFQLRGYVVMGSNGEYVMLTEEEKIALLETARNAIPPDRLMIVGTGCQSVYETLRLTTKAAEIGADAALIITPSYYKSQMTPETLIHYYKTVADKSPLPIIIYNMPANTGIDLDADTIASIAKHPNVIGLKESSGNVVKIGTVRAHEGPGFQVLAGSGGFLLPALSVGAVGGILALANIAPGHCIMIHQLFNEGRVKEAQAIQLSLIALNTLITSKWGVPALKTAMDTLGLYGGPVRMPLLPISPENKKVLNSMLSQTGLIGE